MAIGCRFFYRKFTTTVASLYYILQLLNLYFCSIIFLV
jgi:hypothetical protein